MICDLRPITADTDYQVINALHTMNWVAMGAPDATRPVFYMTSQERIQWDLARTIKLSMPFLYPVTGRLELQMHSNNIYIYMHGTVGPRIPCDALWP
jgi:hypothetical protein